MAQMNRQKVAVSELRKGMYVCELDRPWLETPFLTQGFPLLDEDDIRTVSEHCEHVFVDVALSQRDAFPQREAKRATDRRAGRQAEACSEPRGVLSRILSIGKSQRVRNEVARPVHEAKVAYDDTRKLVRTVFDDVRLGSSIDTPQAKAVVSKCVEQVVENPDAMLLLTSIKNKDNYTAEHSLNVSILSIVLGKRLGLERAKLEELGACGLLHDVGKILSPDDVLKKPGRLTPEEFLIMKMHPSQGRDILMSSKGALGSAIDVAHAHHERLDGSGYPRGLGEDQLTLYTRIVSVVDTYDAITSNRTYDAGRSNIEAFKVLQSQGGNHYDSQMVTQLIHAIGLYPPGCVVQLNNGEIAVVARVNPARKLQPKVLLVKNAKLKPLTPRYIDLANPAKRGDAGLRIIKQVRAEDVGVDTHVFRDMEFLRSLSG